MPRIASRSSFESWAILDTLQVAPKTDLLADLFSEETRPGALSGFIHTAVNTLKCAASVFGVGDAHHAGLRDVIVQNNNQSEADDQNVSSQFHLK